MLTININTSPQYSIYTQNNLLCGCGELIRNHSNAKTFAIITDDIVDKLYSEKLIQTLNSNGCRTVKFVFPHGEEQKSEKTLFDIYEFLSANQITRTDCLIALGGGVTGDITGYAAATYLRGLDFIQIPTTLLSQIDSSVGGKTGINIASGKNLVGAFKQPICVVCDPSVLSTLNKRELSDGMAEVVKYGMIKSATLFEFIEKHSLEDLLDIVSEIIPQCIEIKKQLVEADTFDRGERMLLNFGHTFGHSIEKISEFQITHGSGVAIGMCIVSEFDKSCSYIDRLKNCLKAYDLPTECEYPLSKLAKICLNDKKRDGDTLNLIICDEIGDSRIQATPIDNILLK